MIPYRKAYEVIGFAYEADLHCLECTSKRFNGDAYALNFTAIDSEGNIISPVFLGDDHGYHCGNCLLRLDGEDDIPADDDTDSDGEDGE